MQNYYKYPGQELTLFENAVNWKKYFASHIAPVLKGKVLEVGAGIGGTTSSLNNNSSLEWYLYEPDEEMRQKLRSAIINGELPANSSILEEFPSPTGEKFDAIIYIDVLEHITQDGQELKKAAEHLLPGGHLVVLSPAFQFLYSPFDMAVGHYRRYNRKEILALTPSSMAAKKIVYLDSAGFFASLMNKLLLKQKYPTKKQISLWDNWMIPVSKITDHIFFHSFGKSILGIWEKH
jgi:2-polyprenyl-3-methyl-5-hydroxy-6-metoxy-1,4-benzoquinol methylase